MQTHHDDNHRASFLSELRRRAEEAEKARSATIATDGEALAVWKSLNGMYVKHLPDDPQGILRISVGGGDHLPVTLNYCAVRGKISECISLLEKAVQALKECPE